MKRNAYQFYDILYLYASAFLTMCWYSCKLLKCFSGDLSVLVSSECSETSIGRFWHLEEYVHQCSQNPLEKKYWHKVRLKCNNPKDFNNIGRLSNSIICIWQSKHYVKKSSIFLRLNFLLVACCLLLLHFAHYFLLVARFFLVFARYFLLIAHYSLLIVPYFLLVACYFFVEITEK